MTLQSQLKEIGRREGATSGATSVKEATVGQQRMPLLA